VLLEARAVERRLLEQCSPSRQEDTMKTSKERTVEEFMSTATLSVKETDTLDRVREDMVSANIRHMLVIDAHNRLIGIISDRDVLKALAFSNGKPIPVSKVMTRNVQTVYANTLAHSAVRIMLDEKISALPVLGDDRQVVGVLTATDFLIAAHQALAGMGIDRIAAEL
jgi:CBS domain-containing protein